MAQIIRGRNRKGRSAQFVVYDLQGNTLPQEVLEKLEGSILRFIEESSWGKSLAITVNVE